MKSPDEILRDRIRALGFKSVAAAVKHFKWPEKLGISAGAIYHHFNGTRRIRTKSVAQQYAADLGLSTNQLLGLDDSDAQVGNAQITGKAKWGEWLDTSIITDMAEKGVKTPSISVPRGLGRDMRRAVAVADGSVNRVIQPGDYAIYEPVTSEDVAELTDGYLYILRRRGDLEERTVRKIAARTNGKLVLESHSTDARYSGDVTYPSSKADETVEIIGRVVGRYAPL
jgi:phage repressor protein C with HTH and peptisase S24 domain